MKDRTLPEGVTVEMVREALAASGCFFPCTTCEHEYCINARKVESLLKQLEPKTKQPE